MITSKGAAGVTGSGFIVLASTLSAMRVVPLEGIETLDPGRSCAARNGNASRAEGGRLAEVRIGDEQRTRARPVQRELGKYLEHFAANRQRERGLTLTSDDAVTRKRIGVPFNHIRLTLEAARLGLLTSCYTDAADDTDVCATAFLETAARSASMTSCYADAADDTDTGATAFLETAARSDPMTGCYADAADATDARATAFLKTAARAVSWWLRFLQLLCHSHPFIPLHPHNHSS
jgi:hypothetical protein